MIKKLVAVLITLTMLIACFSGCKLLSVNNERDMAQIVATVVTKGDGDNSKEYTDNVYKRELVSMFNSTGYQYVQNGYTYKQTYELILDSLIQRKILLHEAKRDFPSDINASKETEIEKYLQDWEITKANYIVKKSINGLLDSFEEDVIKTLNQGKDDKDENTDYKEWEGYKDSLRAVITGADKEEDVKLEEEKDITEEIKNYKLIINFASEVNGSTSETRKKAYNKMVKAIDYYNLLGNDTFKNFEQSAFYKDELKSQEEQVLLNKYIEKMKKDIALIGDGDENAKIKISYQDVFDRYLNKYNEEKEKYSASVVDYKKALEGLTKDNYLLFNPFDDYGFVYNIVIPFDKLQTYELEKLKTKFNPEKPGSSETDKDKYKKARVELLNQIKGTDLRASWITNGFEIDLTTKLFEEKMYNSAKEENGYKGYPFQGDIKKVKKDGTAIGADEEVKKSDIYYKIDTTNNNYTIDEIMAKVEAEFNANGLVASGSKNGSYDGTPNQNNYYSGAVNLAGDKDKIKKANSIFEDLMFAYSSDAGALNKYLGYAYPASSTFVDEFNLACEKVIKQGVGAYTIIGTDYGWHIVYCTKQVQKTATGEYVKEYSLNQNEFLTKDTFTNKFAKSILDEMQADYYTLESAKLFKKLNVKDNVTKYEKRFKDLILDKK